MLAFVMTAQTVAVSAADFEDGTAAVSEDSIAEDIILDDSGDGDGNTSVGADATEQDSAEANTSADETEDSFADVVIEEETESYAEGETVSEEIEATETETSAEELESIDSKVVSVGETNSCGDNATYTLSANGTLTISGSGAIIDGAFKNNTEIKKVVMEEGINKIGEGAFYGCKEATEIILPESIETIEVGAFEGCSKLSGIKIPEKVTTIKWRAFGECDSLTEVTIPKNVVNSGGDWFDSCDKLKKIILEKGMTTIPYHAFCYMNTDFTINIPDSVTTIGEGAFYGCKEVTEIILPESIETIEVGAFEGCSKLSGIKIPEKVTTIKWRAFRECDSLTEVTIPKNVVNSGGDWFDSCDKLKKIILEKGMTTIPHHAFRYINTDFTTDIPESLIEIGEGVFEECSKMSSIEIPESITKIDYYAFNNCTSLKDVYYKGTQAQWKQITVDDGNESLVNATFHYGEGQPEEKLDPPGAPAVTAAAKGHKTALITWKYNGNQEYFKSAIIYRSENGTDYTFVKSFSDNTTEYYDTVSFNGSSADYCYKVQVYDQYNRNDESTPVKVTLVSADTEKPTAVITPDGMIYASVGEKVTFTARGSSDNDGIASVKWDMGDGTSESGTDISHSYAKEGNYTVTLTVTDNSGNTGTDVQNVTVVNTDKENSEYSLQKLKVCDSVSANAVSGATIYITENETDTRTFSTGGDGVSSCVLKNGTYVVAVCADRYMVRTVRITLEGGVSEQTIGLTKSSIMSGELSVQELTKEEIIKAGIDTSSEGNNHVYRFKTILRFVAGPKIYEFPVEVLKNEKGEVVQRESTTFTLPLPDGNPGDSGGGTRFMIFPISESFALVIYGEAHWLKEMYKVELVVTNQSNTDTLEDVTAELSLPDGMSLADMTNGAQTALQKIGSIGYSGSGSASWYVRGDKEGEYNLTATVNAVSMPYGEKLTQTYTTTSPVRVYAGSALHLTISAEDVAERGKDYKVIYHLENVSDKLIYNLSFGLLGSEQYKVIGYKDKEIWQLLDSSDYGDSFTKTVEELAPGGYIELELNTTIWFNSVLELTEVTSAGAYVDAAYYLTDVSMVTLGGSTTEIPYSIQINHKKQKHAIDKAIDKTVQSVYSDVFNSVTAGDTLVQLIGDSAKVPLWMVKAAKTVLKLQQGQTDNRLVVSIDDGKGTSSSIYNDQLLITTGTAAEVFFDVVNKTKVTISASEISIQARGAGSTKVKVGIMNSAGEMETQFVYDVTVADQTTKYSLKLKPDKVTGTYSVDEKKIETAISAKQAQEKAIYEKNPYLWLDSELELDVSGQDTYSSFDLQMKKDSLGELIDNSTTKRLTVKGTASELSFDREALLILMNQSSSQVNIAGRRLSDEECQKMGSDMPTYEFTAVADNEEIADFGEGSVYISLPYELKGTEKAGDLYVEHIKDDGTIENIDAEYDSETNTVHFTGNGFSCYRIAFKEGGEHVFETVIDRQPTCSQTGEKHEVCKYCQYAGESVVIPATGKHQYNDSWTVIKTATAVSAGLRERSCTVCGHKETESIEKLKPVIKLNVSAKKLLQCG